MDKKILIDTDIIVKSYKGDKNKHHQLTLLRDRFSISIVTSFELLIGAQNLKQLASIKRELKSYDILPVDAEISKVAFQLFAKHTLKKRPKVPDMLIAATALRFNLKLYTDNKKDYDFIEDVQFYKER